MLPPALVLVASPNCATVETVASRIPMTAALDGCSMKPCRFRHFLFPPILSIESLRPVHGGGSPSPRYALQRKWTLERSRRIEEAHFRSDYHIICLVDCSGMPFCCLDGAGPPPIGDHLQVGGRTVRACMARAYAMMLGVTLVQPVLPSGAP